MFLRIFLILLWIVIIVSAKKLDYNGYKLYHLFPQNETQAAFLNNTSRNEGYVNFAESIHPTNHIRIIVSPNKHNAFQLALTEYSIKHEILVEDVGEKLRSDGILSQSSNNPSENEIFQKYYRNQVIQGYLIKMGKLNANYVTVEEAGKSYEGRSINYLKIASGTSSNDINKSVIFIEAGMHAREWMGPATALYIITELVNYRPKYERLLMEYDWIFLPLVNPDGYEYTHTTDRMWRKTRSKWNKRCYGVDGNRNFDIHWGLEHAPSNPCAEQYRGPKSFSEPETQIVKKMLESITGKRHMYISLHSYGRYLLHVWGWTRDRAPNYMALGKASRKFVKAIKASTNGDYHYGAPGYLLYTVSGGSMDYAYSNGKFPLSFTIELPGDGEEFDPNPTKILKFADEAWIGIQAMLNPSFDEANRIYHFIQIYCIELFLAVFVRV